MCFNRSKLKSFVKFCCREVTVFYKILGNDIAVDQYKKNHHTPSLSKGGTPIKIGTPLG